MAQAETADGYRLYFETVGAGIPIVFVHEFAGDYRSWEAQLRYFGKTHHCVAFSARGFSPSDIPADAGAYTQEKAVADIGAVMDAARLDTAHVVGLSMGAITALTFGVHHPDRVRSLCLGGCGYGADLDRLAAFRQRSEETGDAIERMGMADFTHLYLTGLGRVQFANKDPRGFAAFRAAMAAHDPLGSAMTQRYLQGRRPSLYALETALRALAVPTLIMVGDEDFPCLEPALFLKRTIRAAALSVLPNSGHSINQEEPEAYNRTLADFLRTVDAGRWPTRDPRAETLPDFTPDQG